MEEEKEHVSIFEETNEILNIEKEGLMRHVSRARTTLFILGVLLFLSELYSLHQVFQSFDFGMYFWGYLIALLVIFIGLGLWTYKKPDTALLFGLIVYLGLILYAIYLGYLNDGWSGVGSSVFSGILVKGLFIYLLVKGYRKAKEYLSLNHSHIQ